MGGLSHLPSEEDLGRLPRWAVVAFAARCARRAYAYYAEFPSWNWVTEAVETAIEEAESVAATGQCRSGHRRMLDNALKAIDSLRDSVDAPGAMLFDRHYGAIGAADAAVAALQCAMESSGKLIPTSAGRSARQAAVSLEAAAAPREGERSIEAERAIHQDLALLTFGARKERWTNDVLVPPHFFVVNTESAGPIFVAIRQCSNEIARNVAVNPGYLDQLEWRDVERLIATVFEGLGFLVHLTPASRDRGKDVVLECVVNRGIASYVVEIKHWRSRKRVGPKLVKEFVGVVAREERDGGVFLATYGYSAKVVEVIAEIDRGRVELGDWRSVATLCRTYIRAERGIWEPTEALPDLLFSSYQANGSELSPNPAPAPDGWRRR